MDMTMLTEQEIRTRFITPAISKAGWSFSQIREEYAITKGRIITRGGTYKRDKAKFADYVLFYRPHIPLAIVEAKGNNHSVSDGMQQALDYVERLLIPFVFTSNGDSFTFHNMLFWTRMQKDDVLMKDKQIVMEILSKIENMAQMILTANWCWSGVPVSLQKWYQTI